MDTDTADALAAGIVSNICTSIRGMLAEWDVRLEDLTPYELSLFYAGVRIGSATAHELLTEIVGATKE